jgi:hypothetical protein
MVMTLPPSAPNFLSSTAGGHPFAQVRPHFDTLKETCVHIAFPRLSTLPSGAPHKLFTALSTGVDK